MPSNFTNTLNTNEFYSNLFNGFAYVYTYGDNLASLQSEAEKYKVDAGMYRDQLVYTDVDVLMSRVWDPSASNVLAPEMVAKPVQQSITVNKKRQIGLYNQEYFEKRIWMNASTFDTFASVVQSQVSTTKKLHDQRMMDVYLGTTTATGAGQNISVDVTTATSGLSGEEKARVTAQTVAKAIADLFVDLADSTRDFNDNGFMKSFSEGEFDIYWNKEWANQILYIDLPTVFHKDNLFKKGKIKASRYFGHDLTSSEISTLSSKADGTTTRAAEEYAIRVDASGNYSASGTIIKNVFPGDLLPTNTPLVISTTAETTGNADFTVNGRTTNVTYYSTCHGYVADSSVICKIIHKDGVKYASAMQTESQFWNPRNLSTNRYLTWCFAKPDYLAGKPYITLKKV